MVIDKYLDAIGGNPKIKKDRSSEYDLTDIWRIRDPSFRQFTRRASNPSQMTRLDHFPIFDDFKSDVSACSFMASLNIDHSRASISPSTLSKEKERPNHWKFNDSLM